MLRAVRVFLCERVRTPSTASNGLVSHVHRMLTYMYENRDASAFIAVCAAGAAAFSRRLYECVVAKTSAHTAAVQTHRVLIPAV